MYQLILIRFVIGEWPTNSLLMPTARLSPAVLRPSLPIWGFNMYILHGFVQSVIMKNEDDSSKNTFAYVVIDDTSTDRDGVRSTVAVKIMVAGNDFKKGLHNAYRSLIGSEVFAPVNVAVELFNDKPQKRVNLMGPPLRLEETRPVQSSPAKVATA